MLSFCCIGSISPPPSINDSISVDSNAVFFFFDKIYIEGSSKKYYFDTLTFGFQDYNPIFTNTAFFASSGNVGLPYKNLMFSLKENSGFNLGFNSVNAYLFKNENIKYYDVVIPFSEVFYVQGANNEQLFSVIHSQNIRERLNLGLKYSLVNSPGSYVNQKSDNSNVYLNSYYISKNSKYGFVANFIYNRVKVEENGGISNYRDFEDSTAYDRRIISVNLISASSRIKESNIYFKQYYDFYGNKSNNNDSIKGRKNNFGVLTHIINYNKFSYTYNDEPLASYYQTTYYDTAVTFDTVGIKTLSNTFEWSNSNPFNEQAKNKKLLTKFSITHKYIDIYDKLRSLYFNQIIPSAFVSINASKSVLINGVGSYVFGDYNDGDYYLSFTGRYRFAENNSFMINASVKSKEADWIKKRYVSNHFVWDNSFNKEDWKCLKLSYLLKSLNAGLNYYELSNYVYLDEDLFPKQHNSKLNVIQIYLKKNFALRKFHIDNKIVYQNVNSDDIIKLPEFMGTHTFYYTLDMFKSALISQFGVDVHYFTSYYADAYLPAIQSFYVQNSKLVDDNIFADAFINLKIQRAKIFLKYQHINSGILGYNYYSIPGYPLQDRAFKFGVSWRFYN